MKASQLCSLIELRDSPSPPRCLSFSYSPWLWEIINGNGWGPCHSFLSVLKWSSLQSMLLQSFKAQLFPAAFSSNLLIGVAPWQQAQPRAQEPCLCHLRGWCSLRKRKRSITYPAVCLEDDFTFCCLSFCSASIEDLKLRVENIDPKMLSVTEGSRETISYWFLSPKQSCFLRWVQKVTCCTVTCGTAMLWGCTARWLYSCFM